MLRWTVVAVYSDIPTWVDNAGVTLVDSIAAAGHGIANRSSLERALAADHIVLTAAPTHDVPLWARAVVV